MYCLLARFRAYLAGQGDSASKLKAQVIFIAHLLVKFSPPNPTSRALRNLGLRVLGKL